MVSKNLASVTGRPVGAHASRVHAGIALAIPAAAPLTISNCSIIEVDYIIKVGANGRRVKLEDAKTKSFQNVLCPVCQGSYGHGKPGKVVEFLNGHFQAWKSH